MLPGPPEAQGFVSSRQRRPVFDCLFDAGTLAPDVTWRSKVASSFHAYCETISAENRWLQRMPRSNDEQNHHEAGIMARAPCVDRTIGPDRSQCPKVARWSAFLPLTSCILGTRILSRTGQADRARIHACQLNRVRRPRMTVGFREAILVRQSTTRAPGQYDNTQSFSTAIGGQRTHTHKPTMGQAETRPSLSRRP